MRESFDFSRCRQNESLKKHTTFCIGGGADYFFTAHTAAELESAASVTEMPVAVLGRGSNVLFGDGGFRGLVVENRADNAVFLSDVAVAESGISLARLARLFYMRGLAGMEFASQIPGSLGGALVMNAGAFGSSIADVVRHVDVLQGGKKRRLEKDECGFGYRKSVFKDGDVILSATLEAKAGDKAEIKRLRDEYMRQRALKQPTDFSAGSVFMGGEKPAGWYIDRAGLKGLRIGGAQVSDIHANFIVNRGLASAGDVRALIRTIKAEVLGQFGVKLKEEIRYLGEF